MAWEIKEEPDVPSPTEKKPIVKRAFLKRGHGKAGGIGTNTPPKKKAKSVDPIRAVNESFQVEDRYKNTYLANNRNESKGGRSSVMEPQVMGNKNEYLDKQIRNYNDQLAKLNQQKLDFEK